MRTIKGLFGATAIAAALLVSGCGATQSDQPINLTDATQLNQLCGTKAHDIANTVSVDANAQAGSGKRNELKYWGLDPSNDKQIADIQTKLNARQVPCTTASAAATPSASPTSSPSAGGGMKQGDATVADANGKREGLPSLSGGAIPNGNTTNIQQMPPLSGALALDCGTLQDQKTLAPLQGWDSLVPCIDKSGAAGQQYKDQVNKMHDEGTISFTWSDVQKWASAKTKDGKLPESRVIQVYGYTQAEMPIEQARINIADLVGGKDVAETLQVVYKPASFIDTLRPLYKDQVMSIQEFVDFNKQVRVSLEPLVLDQSGTAVGVDTNSASGIFADCYNIHGMKMFMPSVPGAQLVCQPGTPMAGQPLPENGECTPPPATPICTTCECAGNCVPQCTTCECAGNCLQAKGPSIPNGWTPLGSGPLTNGKQSQQQQQSGQVSGNVTDNKVPSGTISGSTTPDLPKGTVTAPGATSGGDNSAGVPRDTGSTTTGGSSTGTGGTSGATCITDPDTGATTCK
jgi:hypothetical protein